MDVRIAIDHSSAQLQWVVYKWYGCFSFVRNLWLHARLFEGSSVPVVARKCLKRSFFCLFFTGEHALLAVCKTLEKLGIH